MSQQGCFTSKKKSRMHAYLSILIINFISILIYPFLCVETLNLFQPIPTKIHPKSCTNRHRHFGSQFWPKAHQALGEGCKVDGIGIGHIVKRGVQPFLRREGKGHATVHQAFGVHHWPRHGKDLATQKVRWIFWQQVVLIYKQESDSYLKKTEKMVGIVCFLLKRTAGQNPSRIDVVPLVVESLPRVITQLHISISKCNRDTSSRGSTSKSMDGVECKQS